MCTNTSLVMSSIKQQPHLQPLPCEVPYPDQSLVPLASTTTFPCVAFIEINNYLHMHLNRAAAKQQMCPSSVDIDHLLKIHVYLAF